MVELLPALISIFLLDLFEYQAEAVAHGEDLPQLLNTFVFEKLLPHISVVFIVKNIDEKFVIKILFALNLRMVNRQDDKLKCVVIHTYIFRKAQIVNENLTDAFLAARHNVIIGH